MSQIDILGSNGDVLFVKGVVGVVTRAPFDTTHSYRVQFMDGTIVTMKRAEFAIRRHFTDAPDHRLEDYDLFEHIIFKCIVGSRAYGLDHEESDTDMRGIYLPPADLHWSLYGVPEQIESPQTEETYWELQKFIKLALKANPNVLECLYTPMTLQIEPLAQALLDQREMFLSRLVYQTYSGYVTSQFRKLRKHLENYGEIRWKHVMHLLRLLISGITVLENGYIPVRVEEFRDDLLAIRHEKRSWDEANEWRKELQKQFDDAFATTTLPDRPDYEAANAFLIKARRSAT